MKDKQGIGQENSSFCRQCLDCLQCCQLPASTGVKIVSVISIVIWLKKNDIGNKMKLFCGIFKLLGLVLSCLGVWMTIVTTSNHDMPKKEQVIFYNRRPGPVVITSEDVNSAKSPSRKIPWIRLSQFHNYLLALSLISLCVGIVRTISSIFLLWNSVEKHSKTPGKVWILLSICGTSTLFTFLIVTLNATGFIEDVPWSPTIVRNDKFSFYLLLCIFRLVSFFDIFLTIYFILIVLWFVRTR